MIAQQNDDEVLAAELDAFVGQAQQPSFESDAAAAGWLDAFQRQATGALDAVTPEQGFVSGFGSGFIGTAGTMARATRLPEELVMNTLGALGLDESSQKVVRAAVELMPGTQGLRMIQRQGEKAQQVAGELAQGRPTFRGSVGQAAGSAIAMAPASVVGGVGAAGAVGAALEAESALETGEALGASPGQKLGGMAAGAALGAIEGGFGPEKELAKLGKVLRGGSSEVRQRVAASILGAMVKSGAEEAGEEFVQGMGEEAIAQFIYEDPERNGRALAEWLSTSASVALDQGLPAAIVGAVLGGLARTGQLQRMAEVGKAVRPDAPLTDFGQIAKEQAGERTPGEVGPEWEQLRASLEKQNRTPVRYVESGENAQASRVQDLAKKLGLEVQFVEAMPKDVKPAAPPSQPPVVGQVGFPEDVTQGVLSDTSRTPPASGAIEPASAPPQMPTEPTMFGPEERRSKGVRGDVVTPKVVQPNLLDIQKGDIKGQRSMLDDPEVAQGVKAKSEAAAGVTEEPRKWTRSEARNDLQLKDSNIKIAGKRKRVGLYVTYGDNLKWFGEVYTGDGGPLKSDRIGDLWRINGELHVVDTEYGVIQKISRPIDAKEVAKSGTFSPTVSGSFKEQRWRWVGKPPVVAETQPAKPAARTMADRIKARHADASNGRLGFRAWVRAMGGLNIQKSGDLGGELRDLRESGNENSFGLGPLVRGEKSSIGVSLDGVLEAAMERGYLPQGSGVREVLELLDSDFTPEKADIDAQKFMAEEAKALEDQAKAAGYASFEDYQAKQDEIDAQARREGWDPDAPVTERTDDDTDVPFAAQRGPGLRYPAAYLGGRVAIDINNTSPVKLLFHEGLHHLAAANPKGFDTLLRAMTDLKPEQIAAARRAYEAAFGENAPKGTALDEEAAAVFSEDMAGLLEQAFNDPAKLARVFADRNVFQVVRDWIARLAKTFGGSMQTTIEKRLAEVEASDSAEVGLALLWKETADMAAWGDATDEERAKFAAAYHGTPFDFDRFDMSKVGTGEGAQAYGHGLYFAGNKDIAEHYRKKLSAPARSLDQKAREVYDQYDDPTDAEAAFMSRPDFSESERTLLQSLKSDGWLGFDFPHQAVRAALGDKLDNFDPSPETRAAVDAVKSERRGKLYEVELAPQEDEYLLWDKPLSEQSEKVKAALLNRWPKWVKREMDESNPLGGMFYEDVSVEFRSQKAASAALHAAGIRGIKYLDGSSRSKGEGDYNYVLFDDKDVSIKAKFAVDRSQTETPEFKRWFGDSKVVDEGGKPLAVYHGTDAAIERFDNSKLGSATGAKSARVGHWFVDRQDVAVGYANHAALEATVRRAVERADALEAKAQRSGKSSDWDAHTAAVDAYEAVQREMDAERNRGQNVVPAYLSIQNPATFDAGGESFMDQQDEINAFLRAAKRDGHDGAILTNLDDDPGFNGRVGTHYVAFKPEQIKSATGNRGTFDPANPDIRFAVDRNSPGDDGQAITTVFQGALQRRSDGWFWRSGKPAPNVRDDTPSQSYNFRVSLRSGGKFVEVPLSRKMDPDLAWVFESQRLGRYITGVDNDREVSRQERSGEEYPTLSAQPVFEDGDIPGISEPGIALRKTRDATKARAVYVPIADWDLWSNGTVTGALWNKADEPEILLQAKLEGWSPPARFAVSPEDRARMPVRLESPASKIDPTSAPDVVAALAKAIEAAGGQTPIRVGRMGRRSKTAAGFFKVGPEVIRLKTANDIPTAAHETAHALEKHVYGWPKGGPWKNPLVDIATQKELTTLGRKLYGDTKPAGGYKREGFAEYVRLYVSDPGSLPDAAPNFHKWFTEAFLPSQPEIAKQLDKARDLTTRWREQGAVARARASVIDPASLGERWKRAKEKLRYTRIASTMWESGEAIKEAESAAAARKDLTADQKPYTTFDELRLTHDAKVAYMVEKGMIDFNANVVGGPLTDIRPLIKGKYNDFLVFLWAKRALALRASGRNAGISIEDAAQIVEELGSEKFQLAASKLYAWNEGVLDYISQASPHFARVVARIRASDPGSYIPLQREMDDVDRRWGGGVSDGGSPLKRLKGSGRRIKDPLQTVLARSRKLVLAAHQRKVLDQVVALHRIEGMGKWVEEIPPSKVPLVKQSLGDVLEKIEQKVDPLGEGVPDLDALREQFFDMLDLSMTEFGDKQQPDSKDPIIPYWEDGEVRWFQVNPDLYRALSTMENYRLPGMVGAVAGGMTRTFRAGTTGLRAAFGMVRNPIRDLPTLYLNSRANRNGAALLGTWAHEMGKSFVSAASGGAVTDEWADLAQRLGVTMAQPLGQDISPTKRAARRLSQGVVVRTLDPRNWFDWYREFIQFPEGATRTTEIRAIAREIGWKPGEPMTREQAQRLTLVGKKVTTDFTASGNFARVMNQIIPFFNSAIQGPRSTIQAAREHPLRYMLRGAAITASTVALWLQNKDEDWWKEISDEEKFSSWHFEIEHDGKTEIVRIPRPYEIGGVFAALPEAMLEAWYNEDPDAAEHWAREFVSITTPDITPAAAKPVIEWLANYDFFRQRPIVPRSEENKPEAEQAGPFTSRLARVLGEWTDKSPRKIDHTINAIFGPVAGDVVTALGLGAEARAAKGELAETPVVGTLFRRGGPLISRPKSVDALYDAYSAALKVQASDKVDETREQREARLMLQDAIQAVGALSYIRWESPKQEVREAAYQEMVKIARDAQTAAKDGSARAGLYDRASKMAKREKERLKRELEGSKGN